MQVLALDTALGDVQACVLAVVPGEVPRVLGASGAPAAGNAEALGDHVAAALQEAGISLAAIDRTVVTVGPGSFTGVRVGLAYAKGWGVATNRPVLGVTTLEGLARSAGGAAIAAIDARHGALYAARFDAGFAMADLARQPAEAVRAAATAAQLELVGPATAIAALGAGRVIERIDLAAVAAVAWDDPDGRPPRAAYVAQVDAAPQLHKALARA